jgi:hypothetical protein
MQVLSSLRALHLTLVAAGPYDAPPAPAPLAVALSCVEGDVRATLVPLLTPVDPC